MNIRTMLAAGCALASLSTTLPAYAITYHLSDDRYGTLRLSGSMGMLKGDASEYVYKENGSHLSELNWRIPETQIAKLGVSWDINDRINLDLRGWTTLSAHKTQMDDYDWTRDDAHWSNWSTHPDTTLRYATMLEMGLNAWLITAPSWRLGLATGYDSSRFAWSSRGGQYRYNDGEQVGSFDPDARVVDYQQRYDVPWMGIAGQVRTGHFEMNALAKFSNAARGVGEDTHYLRGLSFRDEVERARYYGMTLDAGYYMTSQFKLFTEATWNYYEESKGHSTVTDAATNQSYVTGEGNVGMRRQDYSVSMGMQLSF